ncbi:hypothetical protein Drorol1_Dr00017643, partial [Drosera rotundifolia]
MEVGGDSVEVGEEVVVSLGREGFWSENLAKRWWRAWAEFAFDGIDLKEEEQSIRFGLRVGSGCTVVIPEAELGKLKISEKPDEVYVEAILPDLKKEEEEIHQEETQQQGSAEPSVTTPTEESQPALQP